MVLQATAKQLRRGGLLITVHARPNQDLSELGVKKAVYRYEATTPGNVRLLKAGSQ
jgi:hypothetical protein